jgi:hypothetical protein
MMVSFDPAMDDAKPTTWHFCEHIKNWVGGPIEDCTFHKRLDKRRRLVKGANTMSEEKK